MRAFTKAELKRREAKLEAMGPDGRAWLYQREMEIRAQGDKAWDEYVTKEFGPEP